MAVGEEGEGGDGGCLSGEVLILSYSYILLVFKWRVEDCI